ncbi:MAG: hypothetical protein KFB96_25865 [Thiocapsa sp.]|uniref:hypothetical protein n=1 Tax=Thiocapsa sp. TaxID=2024551 RepID=UPI001BCFB6CE|nr:hypothetical protein [Thiocapsa sp.]QVL48914.1 MAG: hypothetical protein KFB96_25865 [Thiocapsa sp.]
MHADNTARERILLHWERSISDALSSRDQRGLRSLQASIDATAKTFTGAAKTRARATMARCVAARRTRADAPRPDRLRAVPSLQVPEKSRYGAPSET